MHYHFEALASALGQAKGLNGAMPNAGRSFSRIKRLQLSRRSGRSPKTARSRRNGWSLKTALYLPLWGSPARSRAGVGRLSRSALLTNFGPFAPPDAPNDSLRSFGRVALPSREG